MGLENTLSLSNLESAWDRKKARSLGSSSMPSQESNLPPFLHSNVQKKSSYNPTSRNQWSVFLN
jgi:hypothetical protein